MQLSNILVISGKPDLNELISQARAGAVVQNIVTGQKFTVFKNDRISSLGEIRIYTLASSDGEAPIADVFQNLLQKLQSKPTDFDPKKADTKTLFDLFAQVLPDYDPDRVHTSDVRKVLYWYNILLAAGKLQPDPQQPQDNTNLS